MRNTKNKFELDSDELEKLAAAEMDHRKYILPGGGLDVDRIWRDYNAKGKASSKAAHGIK